MEAGKALRAAGIHGQAAEDSPALMYGAVLGKESTKPAQDLPAALRKEKAEPWAIDVLVE